MLFAEASTETWVTVGASAVMALTTIATGLFAWLGSKDRGRIATLEEKVTDCEDRHEACEESHTATRTELATVKAESRARDVKDRSELEAKIAKLQSQVDAKKDDTGEHRPLSES